MLQFRESLAQPHSIAIGIRERATALAVASLATVAMFSNTAEAGRGDAEIDCVDGVTKLSVIIGHTEDDLGRDQDTGEPSSIESKRVYDAANGISVDEALFPDKDGMPRFVLYDLGEDITRDYEGKQDDIPLYSYETTFEDLVDLADPEEQAEILRLIGDKYTDLKYGNGSHFYDDISRFKLFTIPVDLVPNTTYGLNFEGTFDYWKDQSPGAISSAHTFRFGDYGRESEAFQISSNCDEAEFLAPPPVSYAKPPTTTPAVSSSLAPSVDDEQAASQSLLPLETTPSSVEDASMHKVLITTHSSEIEYPEEIQSTSGNRQESNKIILLGAAAVVLLAGAGSTMLGRSRRGQYKS